MTNDDERHYRTISEVGRAYNEKVATFLLDRTTDNHLPTRGHWEKTLREEGEMLVWVGMRMLARANKAVDPLPAFYIDERRATKKSRWSR